MPFLDNSAFQTRMTQPQLALTLRNLVAARNLHGDLADKLAALLIPDGFPFAPPLGYWD